MDRARLAAAIIGNPVWRDTFEALGKYYYEAFRAAPDVESRTRIALANDILDDFESFLNLAINEGAPTVGDNNE